MSRNHQMEIGPELLSNFLDNILQSQIRSPSETPIIDLSVDEKVDDSNVFVPETVTTIGDLLGSGSINQSIEPILPASDQNVEPGMPISESTALTSDKSDLPENTLSKPKEKIYESEEGIPVYVLQNLSKLHSTITQLYDLPADPLVGEKNFVVTPAYTIKPKPTEETYLEIEMTKVIDEPIEAITELSLVELEIAHPKSTPFKREISVYCWQYLSFDIRAKYILSLRDPDHSWIFHSGAEASVSETGLTSRRSEEDEELDMLSPPFGARREDPHLVT
nr:hypothetical protein Iba_chr11cCG9650 [Ipomoea batatas]